MTGPEALSFAEAVAPIGPAVEFRGGPGGYAEQQAMLGMPAERTRAEIAAFAALRSQEPAAAPLQRWHARVARRRGKKTAIVALARKLLTIALHLLREGTTYDTQRLRLAA